MEWIERKIQVEARIQQMAKGNKIYIEEDRWTEAELIYNQKEVKDLQTQNPDKTLEEIAEMLLNQFITNYPRYSK
jgi:hypothetical protein